MTRQGLQRCPRAIAAGMAVLAFQAALLSVPRAARADDPAPSSAEPGAPAAAPAAAPAPPDLGPPVVTLEPGDPAPYLGLLVGEARFVLYAGQQTEIARLTGLLSVRETLLRETAEELAQARIAHEETTAPSFMDRYDFLLGFLLGAVATGVLVWGAVEVLDSTRPETADGS